jgi:hypothetical protein
MTTRHAARLVNGTVALAFIVGLLFSWSKRQRALETGNRRRRRVVIRTGSGSDRVCVGPITPLRLHLLVRYQETAS